MYIILNASKSLITSAKGEAVFYADLRHDRAATPFALCTSTGHLPSVDPNLTQLLKRRAERIPVAFTYLFL